MESLLEYAEGDEILPSYLVKTLMNRDQFSTGGLNKSKPKEALVHKVKERKKERNDLVQQGHI